jgi:hypothetical protein
LAGKSLEGRTVNFVNELKQDTFLN